MAAQTAAGHDVIRSRDEEDAQLLPLLLAGEGGWGRVRNRHTPPLTLVYSTQPAANYGHGDFISDVAS